jgi:hypothetical protein
VNDTGSWEPLVCIVIVLHWTNSSYIINVLRRASTGICLDQPILISVDSKDTLIKTSTSVPSPFIACLFDYHTPSLVAISLSPVAFGTHGTVLDPVARRCITFFSVLFISTHKWTTILVDNISYLS